MFGHNFNVSEEEQLNLVVPLKGRLSLHLLKGSCVQARSPFYYAHMMDPSHPKFRYKGAKPFWLWSTGELLLYFAIIAIILILSYFFN